MIFDLRFQLCISCCWTLLYFKIVSWPLLLYFATKSSKWVFSVDFLESRGVSNTKIGMPIGFGAVERAILTPPSTSLHLTLCRGWRQISIVFSHHHQLKRSQPFLPLKKLQNYRAPPNTYICIVYTRNDLVVVENPSKNQLRKA